MARDLDKDPYSKDEERVLKMIREFTHIEHKGYEDDPIGYVMTGFALNTGYRLGADLRIKSLETRIQELENGNKADNRAYNRP